MRLKMAALALVVATAACAPAATGAGRPASGNRDVVTAEELAATNATNLYDALRQIRPEFFTARGVSSIRRATADLPEVYVDGTLLGDLKSMQTIDIALVRQVRRLTPQEAGMRLGTENPAGALLVTMLKQP